MLYTYDMAPMAGCMQICICTISHQDNESGDCFTVCVDKYWFILVGEPKQTLEQTVQWSVKTDALHQEYSTI